MEWNINDIREQAALQAAEKVNRWKETTSQRLFGKGGNKRTKHTNSSSGTSPKTNKKKFQAKLIQALIKHPEYNTPEWIQYFTTIADLETGGTFNENAKSKTSSAQGYFQILKDNRKTGNQFEDMFNLTASNQKALVRNFGQEGIKRLLQQGYTMPELMALSHFQGANGAAAILRGGKGRRDANGTTPNKYLDIFKSKWPRIIAEMPIQEISPESIRQQLQIPVIPDNETETNLDDTVEPTRELAEVDVIDNIPTPNLAMSEIPDNIQYNFELTPTQTQITPIESQFADIDDIFKQQQEEEMQNILIQNPNLNIRNSVFKYALAENPQEKAKKLMGDIDFQEQLNQAALGGPLFNSRTPIESFQGNKSPLPVVRYDCGGNLFFTGGEKIGEDIIRPLHNKVYNNYEDAVDNNMGPIMTGIRKGLRYIKDNISDSIPAGISNCTLTATQWVDPTNPIMSAKTIVSNPDSVGYSKINADQVVPGDLLIAKVPGKDSYHTMYVSGFDKEGKPLLDYSRGGMGIEENLRTNIPLEWYTANSDGHTQNLYYRNNKFNKTVLPEVIVTGKKMAEGGNLFQNGGNTLLTQNLPNIVVTRPYPSEQQIKQTIEKEWPSAVGLPQYRITKDPTFTRERTGAGSIEYFNEPSITYRNGTTVQNPNQEPTLLFDPNTNTVEDIKLDLLHHYREYDKEYQKLLLDYTNALINNKHTASDLFWNSELGEQYRNKYGKDIEKHWDEWNQMVEENINNDQYLTQAIDGSLRSLMASDALREKSNYDTKEGAEASWLKDEYAKRAYNNIVKYLKHIRALGGTLAKGQQLDLEQDQIDKLIKQGYKIKYIK